MVRLAHYSIGIGDRFARQARAQLRACMLALESGTEVIPVWNKSHREHLIVGSEPASVRASADLAVRELGWDRPYHVDADHIRLQTVEGFLESSDFFTIDVADSIGHLPDSDSVARFVRRHPELRRSVELAGVSAPLELSFEELAQIASKYVLAVEEAGRIYRRIVAAKGEGEFITEVSMDETDRPQSPRELLVILAALADERIPLQTIAPKFSGRFNKGVDYLGDVDQFEREFREDIAVIAHAIEQYNLPNNLKLSVHSGSDKFSLYGPMNRAIKEIGAGLHLKTAGTTWLEEIIGLAEAGGKGLEAAKGIYAKALEKREELCAPYAAVIDIESANLPDSTDVADWTAEQYVDSLRHDPSNPAYNPSFRQLLHVGYKVAAQMGPGYLALLDEYEPVIGRNVTANLFERHLGPLFLT